AAWNRASATLKPEGTLRRASVARLSASVFLIRAIASSQVRSRSSFCASARALVSTWSPRKKFAVPSRNFNGRKPKMLICDSDLKIPPMVPTMAFQTVETPWSTVSSNTPKVLMIGNVALNTGKSACDSADTTIVIGTKSASTGSDSAFRSDVRMPTGVSACPTVALNCRSCSPAAAPCSLSHARTRPIRVALRSRQIRRSRRRIGRARKLNEDAHKLHQIAQDGRVLGHRGELRIHFIPPLGEAAEETAHSLQLTQRLLVLALQFTRLRLHRGDPERYAQLPFLEPGRAQELQHRSRPAAQHVPRDDSLATVDDAGNLIKRSPSRPGRAALVLRRAQGSNAEECSESPEHPFAKRQLGPEFKLPVLRRLTELPRRCCRIREHLDHG